MLVVMVFRVDNNIDRAKWLSTDVFVSSSNFWRNLNPPYLSTDTTAAGRRRCSGLRLDDGWSTSALAFAVPGCSGGLNVRLPGQE